MRIVTSIRGMQDIARSCKRMGTRIGFVPTMGYLHAGHMSLVAHARKLVGDSGVVVVSIYVNPTQFGPKEDLSRYPRDLKRDQQLCVGAGVEVLFVPNDRQMYPGKQAGRYSTYVVEEALTGTMEGVSRPTHFRGVTTVVAKLFNIVQPDVAVFGAKDWQQAAVLKRMVADLNFPLRMVVAPTLRERDGLAMSSRNKYLSTGERPQALALWQSIQVARQLVKAARSPLRANALKQRLFKAIAKHPAARIDYIEFFNPETLQPEPLVRRGTHMALAVCIGKTRLIDNARL